jgi:UDP:flavonoid glycosyltransferase YjiC (YdhE family)
MEYLFYTLGTVGDALPFLKLAAALNAGGARTVFLGNEKFAALARSMDVEFRAVSSREDYEKTYNNPLTWSPAYNQNHYNQFHLPAIRPTFKAIQEFVNDGHRPLVVFQDALSGARMAAVEFDLPFVQIVLAPSGIGSVVSPSYPTRKMVPEASWAQIIPKLVEKSEKDTYERLVMPFINPVRQEVGLKAWKRHELPKLAQSPHVLALFPTWLRERPADWPAQVENTGFVMSSLEVGFSQQRFDEFVDAHGAPITFSFGTGIPVTSHLIDKVARICKEVGRPGVLVAHTECERQVDDFDPPLLVMTVARFDHVFRRSCLVVHHGGIGTCAQAFAAGVPQLVTPYSFDQPDNAFRLWQLGVGNSIDIMNASLTEIVAMVHSITTDSDVAQKVAHYASLTFDAADITAERLKILAHQVREPQQATAV